jgi:hypothetical protein
LETDLIDDLLLEVCCEVVLLAEEYYASLGDCGMPVRKMNV